MSSSNLLDIETAAVQGDVDAQIKLGNMYYHGEGVEQDHTKAMVWYRKAADKETLMRGRN